MLISVIGIRNFKSFGNNEQVLKLNCDKGDLILLVGRNGSGKSSLIENIDYLSKRKKRRKYMILVNRKIIHEI